MDKIEHIVDQYFRTADENNKLELLSVEGMAEAVDWAINKSHIGAFTKVVMYVFKIDTCRKIVFTNLLTIVKYM